MTGKTIAGAIDVRLTAVTSAARTINIYKLESADGNTLPDAEAGAHIDLHLPNGLVRQYSLLNPAQKPVRYEIAIKRDDKGRGGSRFIYDELGVGARLTISPPRNNFPLFEDASNTVLFAGGIGITPIWSMAQRLQQLDRKWSLYCSCRTREETPLLKQLQAIDQVHLHFDDENDGRLLDLNQIVANSGQDAHFYCCGPGPMLRAFERATTGLAAEQVHLEHFGQDLSKQAAAGAFVVQLERSGIECMVPAGKTILEVIRDAGIDVSYSCEQGVCGACEVRVISGDVDHRDLVLTAAERAGRDTMTICCSRCKSDRLVLDL